MKTHLYLLGFIFCFVALLSCTGSKTLKEGSDTQVFELETDWQKAQIKGKVKSIDEIRYYFNYDEEVIIGKGDMERRELTQFNRKGFITSYANYGSENYIVSETNHFYGENGLRDSSYVYNGLGELSEISVFLYDNTGIVSKIENYSPDGDLLYNEIMEYNADRMPVKTKIFIDSEEDIVLITETQYNDKKLKQQGLYHDILQDIYITAKYEYGANEILIKRSYFDRDGESQGIYEFEYEYNNNKNWIRCNEFRDGKQSFIVERIIEYFD